MNFLFSTFLFISVTCVASSVEKVEFRKAKLKIANKTLNIEIADKPKQLQRGLMYRTELAKDSGMLFIFEGERNRSFWMKNTFIDLSIGFFDKDRKLLKILDMEAVNSEMVVNPPRYQSRVLSKYALEVNKGWFKRNKIKLGTRFTLLKPPQN